MRYLIPLLILTGCATQRPPQTVYVTRTVKDCAWLPSLTFSAADTAATKREVIAYETARQKNCPAQ